MVIVTKILRTKINTSPALSVHSCEHIGISSMLAQKSWMNWLDNESEQNPHRTVDANIHNEVSSLLESVTFMYFSVPNNFW